MCLALKYNLKILKAALDTANEYGNVTKWIEGFEAELREKLEFPIMSNLVAFTRNALIKEILGE